LIFRTVRIIHDVEGGWATGAGNINVDPRFTGSLFSLSDSSYCIGAGTDSVQIGGVWYAAPNSCFHGSPRPNPPGSKPDIGACENPRANPLQDVRKLDGLLPSRFELQQNYPNPFNPSTAIRFTLPHTSFVMLAVFNTLGHQVATLIEGEQEAGYHEVHFDGSRLASGMYFYRIQAGSFVETKKLLLIR